MFRLALACLLALLLAACGGQPKLQRLPPDAVILAFGDSLTYGTGATPETSYPAVLAGLVQRRVENAGIPGNTTADGAARFAEALDEHKPALVLLCLGGNDFLQHKPEPETVANLRAMLDLARQRRLPVLLVATPRPGLGIAVPPFYAELAKEYRLPLEDEALADILGQRALKSDPIHPNAEGYRQMAEAVAEALRDSGAV
ncbi:arylesterase [Chitinimonas koreensis]|uniref:arylesterase n=1 Tax=Chitinimonas koreensis TaxID=356302 RepID=UPI00040AD556|nr:arylesterase [Chitinimonas koreensis]QNM98475.1 arylesterase [Chitinimonas koreensis]